MLLWRISNYADLKGLGGMLKSARWHTAGRPVVYLADSPASSLLEIIANTSAGDFPHQMQLLCVKAERLGGFTPKLPTFWKKDVLITREIGDAWLASGKSAMMKVPSALVPDCWNYILNPAHRQADKFIIERKAFFDLDQRLV